jgi:RNA polymerase sigma-70 factor (ECF subfamily)
MELLDPQLVTACQQGDPHAQRTVFEESQARVYRLMVRMVGKEDAADLTQQVYLRVFRSIDKFTGASRLSTWIYRIAVNEALQHLRRKSRHSTVALDHDPIDHAHFHEETSELAEVLISAMAELDPELRAAFVLREVDELSYDTIAEILDIPMGTVGSRLNRARRVLRHRLIHLGWGARE